MDTAYYKKTDEIGSEFWDSFPNMGKRYYLTGRTALDSIIRDILNEKRMKSVLLPSYCCRTMIKPFIRHGLEVRFYDVFFDRDTGLTVSFPPRQADEILYLIRYFGFQDLSGIDYEQIRGEYCVIIEDTTHSWLSDSVIDADYRFTSYKKWTGISGVALAEKRNGAFIENTLRKNDEFVRLREKAFALKRDYIETGLGDKATFLRLFEDAEKLIEDDYCGYEPEPKALEQLLYLDTETIRLKRRTNAALLIRELGSVDGIRLMFHSLSPGDVPLFVPIMVAECRDELKRFLIEKDIYCPVHWPISDWHFGLSERAESLYRTELSLICDQRYGCEEMMRIVDSIREFYHN